ncbi:MAG: hypothetical protein QM757_01035 [Paludibaculum sp.]
MAVTAAEILAEKGFSIVEKTSGKGCERLAGRAGWRSSAATGAGSTPRQPSLSGAHNLQGVKALKMAIDRYFPEKRLTLIMGVLGDKDYKRNDQDSRTGYRQGL